MTVMNYVKDWRTRTPLFVQLFLFLVTVITVSLFFPNQAKFKYDFKQGKAWKYDDLYAPYDFSVRKTREEIDSSQQKIRTEFIPYFTLDRKVEDQSIKYLNSFFTRLTLNVNEDDEERSKYLRSIQQVELTIVSVLKEVLSKGVIVYPENEESLNQKTHIHLQDNGKIKMRSRDEFYTLQQARQFMVHRLSNIDFPESQKEDIIRTAEQSIDPNIRYDGALSASFLEQELAGVSIARGKVNKDDLIVRKGEIITATINQKLLSMKERYLMELEGKSSHWQVYAGHLMLCMLILGLFFFYLSFKYPHVLTSINKLIFFLMWFVIFSYLVSASEESEAFNVYMIPFCIVPIVVKNFFNEGLAFVTLILLAFLTSFISMAGLDLAFITILAGLVAILIETETRYWARYFYSISLIVLSLFTGYFIISLIENGSVAGIQWQNYNWLMLNGILILLSYPLIPLLERIFGFTSAITLAELSDLNKPLLKKLSIKAPGTLQHSIQVANLAEAAATKVGANSLLVKVGALYHDVGKMNNPGFFIENAGDKNLHENLTCSESARIIIAHVHEGVQIARQYKLPPVIIDFIRTHHGTTRVEYFYRKQMALCAEEEVNEDEFTYPGPRPRSKEHTIVMLADSIEAASKSASFETDDDVDNLVDSIIKFKLKERQLEHSELTFDDLEMCRKVFKKMLKGIYNTRIAYPTKSEME